jgi:hypothetical protein
LRVQNRSRDCSRKTKQGRSYFSFLIPVSISRRNHYFKRLSTFFSIPRYSIFTRQQLFVRTESLKRVAPMNQSFADAVPEAESRTANTPVAWRRLARLLAEMTCSMEHGSVEGAHLDNIAAQVTRFYPTLVSNDEANETMSLFYDTPCSISSQVSAQLVGRFSSSSAAL